MSESGKKARHFLVIAGLLLAAGCRYTGPYVESSQDITLTYEANRSTAIFLAKENLGEYELKLYEGTASGVFEGGGDWGLEASPEASSRPVMQPLIRDRLVLSRSGEGVRLSNGAGWNGELRFVSGTWNDYVAGGDVVLRLDDAAWEDWLQACQDGMLGILDRYREQAADRLRSGEELTAARLIEVRVEERPLIRANRRELLVFVEPVTFEGGFGVSSRRKNPRYRWWSYELRPEVGQAIASVAAATVYVAWATVRCCGHVVQSCR